MIEMQLSQALADLSNLDAARPEIDSAVSTSPSYTTEAPQPEDYSSSRLQPPARPSVLHRAWSSEATSQAIIDKYGRRLLSPGATSPRTTSAANSVPGTPRRGCESSEKADELERANTIVALSDLRKMLKQDTFGDSSLLRARAKIQALAAKQQADDLAAQEKAAEIKKRYSFPKVAA